MRFSREIRISTSPTIFFPFLTLVEAFTVQGLKMFNLRLKSRKSKVSS